MNPCSLGPTAPSTSPGCPGLLTIFGMAVDSEVSPPGLTTCCCSSSAWSPCEREAFTRIESSAWKCSGQFGELQVLVVCSMLIQKILVGYTKCRELGIFLTITSKQIGFAHRMCLVK